MVPQQQQHLLLNLLLILSFNFLSVAYSDMAADRAALLGLRAAVGGRTRRWNTSSQSPCQWEGVTCNTTINRVIELRLPGDSLSGNLPENTIGNLTQLQVLSLRRNSLSGPIPSDIGLCIELKKIHFEGNQFSGDIPDGFFKLSNLLHVNLASNELSGQISTEFNNLRRLRTLYLENNQFNGSLPQLNSLSDLTKFNVSFNGLNGSIPERLNVFKSSSFLGNSLCGGPLTSCSQSNGGGGSKLSAGAIAGIVVGSFFGLIFLLLILFISWKKYRKGNQSGQGVMSPLPPSPVKPPEYNFQSPRPFIVREDYTSDNGISDRMTTKQIKKSGSNGGNGGLMFFENNYRLFTLDHLLRASAEVLGKGAFGTTYRAYLETGEDVVVKRLRNVCVSEDEFRERVENLGLLKHTNLAPLRAYFFGKDEKLLVYESFPRSLNSILHGPERATLSSIIRCRVAFRVACGIEYLHSIGSNVSHGNIKSSNILLNRYNDPYLSEYCITKLVPTMPTSSLIGYGAPEVVDSRKVSQKADVYSFGVLLLELLTGKAPETSQEVDEIDLPKWVRSVVQEKWTIQVLDPELLRHQNSEEQMVQLLLLAISCTSRIPEKRPLMKDVTIRIKEICGIPSSD